jgi:hypothetical protein
MLELPRLFTHQSATNLKPRLHVRCPHQIRRRNLIYSVSQTPNRPRNRCRLMRPLRLICRGPFRNLL